MSATSSVSTSGVFVTLIPLPTLTQIDLVQSGTEAGDNLKVRKSIDYISVGGDGCVSNNGTDRLGVLLQEFDPVCGGSLPEPEELVSLLELFLEVNSTVDGGWNSRRNHPYSNEMDRGASCAGMKKEYGFMISATHQVRHTPEVR